MKNKTYLDAPGLGSKTSPPYIARLWQARRLNDHGSLSILLLFINQLALKMFPHWGLTTDQALVIYKEIILQLY